MRLTERQGEILNKIIREYIHSAQPISSHLLGGKYDFGIRSAMIRKEMQALTEKGYLYQPHTSAGRVPTDKGYRFFVDDLIKKGITDFDGNLNIVKEWLKENIDDVVRFTQLLTKNLSMVSSTLVLGYLSRERILWKDGWEEVVREPEFRETNYLLNFADFLKRFERDIQNFSIGFCLHIYIGKENPFSKTKNFSIISSRCHLPQGEEGIISLLGPTRMAYDRNIRLMNVLLKSLRIFKNGSRRKTTTTRKERFRC